MKKKLFAILMTITVIFTSFTAVNALYVPDESTEKAGYYNIYYVYDYEMYGIDPNDEDNPPPPKVSMMFSGSEVTLSSPALIKEGWLFAGWREVSTGNLYNTSVKFTMPTHDAYFEPYFRKYYNLTYVPGDVDDLIVSAPFTNVFLEGTSFETAASSRLTRKGYRLIGWTSDYDGEFTPTNSKTIMPAKDVILTAVWEPSKYTISFGLGGGKGSVFTIDKAEYRSTQRFPLCSYTNAGKVFAGWKLLGEIYKPGEEFTVPALGTGITTMYISAQWTEGELPEPVNSTNLAIKKFEMLNGSAALDEVKEVKDFVIKPWNSYFAVDDEKTVNSDGEVVSSDGEVIPENE